MMFQLVWFVQTHGDVCRKSMRMSPLQLDKSVPIGWDAVATRPQYGDINNELERAGTTEDHGRRGRG